MLSDRAKRVKPSPTLAIDSMAKAMNDEGKDVINFGVGEPDFDTPENIKEAAIKAIREGFTKYTPASGINELKDAIIEKLRIDNNLSYTREEIVISCGAKHSLYNIAQALFEKGDEVIIPVPYWVSYPDQVILNDATPVFVKTDERNSFILKSDVLKEVITSRTKALILNSPSNPTGTTYTKKDLEAIAEICLRHNIIIISDEIYEKLIYDDAVHISIASLGPEIKEKTIVVNGLSKSYSMTGWRIGYAAGPKEIIKAMVAIQSQSTSNPTSIAQKAAVEALRGPQDSLRKMVEEFDRRRIYMVSELNSIPGVSCIKPTGAFYAFPRIDSFFGKSAGNTVIRNSSDLSMYLLKEALVATVPGSAFGDDRYIRLSYATSMENIKKGLARMKEALKRFK
ncbi:MAG: pyridoxal phosphate-dependent aminotransferase [Thermodesulfovibrionales bacterium]|nr:pyridoxal phosphate-dependent aminotransferase [Thermodesulfovibrionales bacterium]